MKMYLHLSDQNISSHEEFVATLKGAGVLLVTNIDENYDADFSEKELRRLKMSGQNLLDKMDAFVIEATSPDPEVGYLLAYAMSQKKPVLYMVLQGTKMGKQIQRLPDNVRLKEYEPELIREVLGEFIRSIEKVWSDAAPNIKFTLRITPQIERYLQWKSKRKKLSKADFLRDRISEDIIAKDEEYKKYLNRK